MLASSYRPVVQKGTSLVSRIGRQAGRRACWLADDGDAQAQSVTVNGHGPGGVSLSDGMTTH
jgi:hypothetical protein